MVFLIIFILICFNGFFALSEIALVSVKRARIEQKAQNKDKNAQRVLSLLDNPKYFLSAVQVGITLIGIFNGAFSGMSLVDDLRPFFESLPFLHSIAQGLAIGTIVGGITFVSIVVGELIPKSIAMNNAEKISLAIAPFIITFTRIMYPLVSILAFSTTLLTKILHVKESDEGDITEDELRHMIKTAGKVGVIEREESQLHQNIFVFSEQRAKNLMTHRTDLEWLDLSAPTSEIVAAVKESYFSKFPVCDGDIDNIKGIVTSRDILEQSRSRNFTLDSILCEPVYIHENMLAIDILKLFKKRKMYVGIVIDEFGTFEGLVTLHDITEALLGDLPDHDDEEEPDFLIRDDSSYLVNGSIAIHQLNANIGYEFIEENPDLYTTLAGFIIAHLGDIPKTGQAFDYKDHRIEIIDLDGQRIDKLIIKQIESSFE